MSSVVTPAFVPALAAGIRGGCVAFSACGGAGAGTGAGAVGLLSPALAGGDAGDCAGEGDGAGGCGCVLFSGWLPVGDGGCVDWL